MQDFVLWGAGYKTYLKIVSIKIDIQTIYGVVLFFSVCTIYSYCTKMRFVKYLMLMDCFCFLIKEKEWSG